MSTVDDVYAAIVAIVADDEELRDDLIKNREVVLKNIEFLVEEFSDMNVYEKIWVIVNSTGPEMFFLLFSVVSNKQ